MLSTGGLRLTKHHGAGNDFLVMLDPDGQRSLSCEEARVLCDRHRGIGADGILRVMSGSDGAALTMELRNADGAVAEMSGNGIRCLAQAAVEAGLVAPPRFTVATAAGVRTVDYEPGAAPGTAWASVDMGPVTLGEDQPQESPGRRARRAEVGNPHLVLFGPDPVGVDVTGLGPRLEAMEPGGLNVEFVARTETPDELVLRVWERGVGETLACGTGSCAAAEAARSWGLVGDTVRVQNPGGPLVVTLGARPGDPVTLAGPVRKVADVVLDRAGLAAPA